MVQFDGRDGVRGGGGSPTRRRGQQNDAKAGSFHIRRYCGFGITDMEGIVIPFGIAGNAIPPGIVGMASIERRGAFAIFANSTNLLHSR